MSFKNENNNFGSSESVTVKKDTVRGVQPGTVRGVQPGTVRGVQPGTVRGVQPGTVFKYTGEFKKEATLQLFNKAQAATATATAESSKLQIPNIGPIIVNPPTNPSTVYKQPTTENNTIVSLIVSHQSRMRCFLKPFLNDNGEYSFMNCSIIRLSFKQVNSDVANIQYSLELVYNGDLTVEEKNEKKGRKYFVKDNYYPNPGKIDPIQFKTQNYSIDKNIFFKMIKGSYDINAEYVFYIVRHGQAEHNENTSKIRKLSHPDTSLTETGKEHAKTAGIELNKLLDKKKIKYLFASDLLRTHETLSKLIEKCNDKLDPSLNSNGKNKVVILPCAHELVFTKGLDVNCDKAMRTKYFAYFAGENRTCHKSTHKACKDKLNVDFENLDVDWKIYDEFYKGDYNRTYGYLTGKFDKTNKTKFSEKRQHCSDTSMIIEAVKYINKPIISTTTTNTTNPTTPLPSLQSGGNKKMKMKIKKQSRKNSKNNQNYKSKKTKRAH
jgi:broad specificity phosphatase PhoE